MSDTQSPWETESNWDTEGVSSRNKLLWFIVNRIKQGASEEQLRKELDDYIKINQFQFLQADLDGMIQWALRKFSPPGTGK